MGPGRVADRCAEGHEERRLKPFAPTRRFPNSKPCVAPSRFPRTVPDRSGMPEQEIAENPAVIAYFPVAVKR